MAATSLNVRLGLLFDEKSLSRVSRQLKRSGEQLSKIGTDLSLSLTAPMLGIGAAAIKSAGDIEALTKALQSQLGSADAAAKELDKLVKVAENPGLGVEEAVRASVRLQGVGVSADQAREIITELGNAIAASGQGAEQFDAVTRQFAQMISKGRVLQEDISVISDSMPNISTLMQIAFKTQNVENIRAMGIGAKEFVAGITEAAKQLPRVEGGIKNNISNALDALKISAGKLGLAINSAFDVSGNLERFATFITDAANAFNNLSDSTKKTILVFAGLLAAAGPVAKVIGSFKTVGSFAVDAFGGISKASEFLSGKLSVLRTAFLGLSTTAQAFVGIGLAVAVVALINYFGGFDKAVTGAAKAQQSLNEATREAESSAAGEKAKIDALIGAITSETASRQEKITAINELKRISPEYFGQLDIETLKYDQLRASADLYVQSIIKAARAKRAEADLIEIDKQQVELKKQLVKAQEELNKQNAQPRAKPLTAAAADSADNARIATKDYSSEVYNLTEALKQLNEQQKFLENEVKGYTEEELKAKAAQDAANESARKAAEAAAKAAAAAQQQTEAVKKLADAYKEVISDIQKVRDTQNLLNAPDVVEEAQAIEDGIKRLIDAGFKPASKKVQGLRNELKQLVEQAKIPILPTIATLPTPTSVQSDGTSTEAPKPETTTITIDVKSNINDVLDKVRSGMQLTQTEAEDFKKYMNESWAYAIADSIQSVIGALSQIISGNAEKEIAELESVYATKIALAEGNAKQQEALEAQLEAKRAEIQKKAGRKKKAAAIAEALINTAVAITKTYAEYGFPIGIPLAVAQGVAGAAQVAVIASQQFARGTNFAPGGMALVGEQGPELVNIPRGSQVLSNRRTNSLLDSALAGGGGAMSGEFTVRGTDLVLVLERARNKQARAF